MQYTRHEGRAPQELRTVLFERDVMKHALGSCLVSFGDTKVLCSATIEEKLPRWRMNQPDRAGWITAEYAMLPTATHQRTVRETTPRGRTQEISRLIARSLRAAVDLRAMPDITMTVDCDVLQADGGTRTAAITGGWIAMHDAFFSWIKAGKMARVPILRQVAAVSVGVVDGAALLDLDYREDSHAEVDMNLVMDDACNFVEVQGTGERITFSRDRLNTMLDLGTSGLETLLALQNECVGWKE